VSECRPIGRFPGDQRVRKRPEFQLAQKLARRQNTPHFALLLFARAPVTDESPPRLGVTVSRRVGVAVVRSRAKRLLREAFRATRDLWPPGMDLVVIVKLPLTGLKLEDVVAEWRAESRGLRRRMVQAEQDRVARDLAVAAPP
jgi:ribonuclease P protein component